jgi:hypothetical protein
MGELTSEGDSENESGYFVRGCHCHVGVGSRGAGIGIISHGRHQDSQPGEHFP